MKDDELPLKMCDDELSSDECETARSFMNAFLAKKSSPELKNDLDKIVGFVRGVEPLMVSECLQAKKVQYMVWYHYGYCLCSRFYKCRYQSEGYVITEGRERAACNKFERGGV